MCVVYMVYREIWDTVVAILKSIEKLFEKIHILVFKRLNSTFLDILTIVERLNDTPQITGNLSDDGTIGPVTRHHFDLKKLMIGITTIAAHIQ